MPPTLASPTTWLARHDELIDLAHHTPFTIWRRNVRALADLLDQDGGYDPDRDLARNHLHLDALSGDQVVLSGELVGEAALEFTQAVEAEGDRLWRQYRNDHDQGVTATIPRRATLLALALVSLCRQGQATDLSATRAPAVDVSLVLHTRDHRTTTDEHDPAAETTTPGVERLTTIDGEPLDAERYAHLICDATFHATLMSSLGVPLDLGHRVRLATPGQRRALGIRDGGCVFPGCDAPTSWCDAHHVQPYEQLGPTDLSNLALLCRRHHGVTHRRGWQMAASADQTFTWITPDGLTLTSQRQRGRPPNPALTFAA